MATTENTVRVGDIPIISDMARTLSFRSIALLVVLDIIAFTNGDFIFWWNVPLGILAFVMVIAIEGFVADVTGAQRKSTGFFALVQQKLAKEPQLLLYALVGGALVAYKGNFLTLAFGTILGSYKFLNAIKA
jgi:hypothetical protein